jgi:hypothetical protein
MKTAAIVPPFFLAGLAQTGFSAAAFVAAPKGA